MTDAAAPTVLEPLTDEQREALGGTLVDHVLRSIAAAMSGEGPISVRFRGTLGGQEVDVHATVEGPNLITATPAHNEHGPAIP